MPTRRRRVHLVIATAIVCALAPAISAQPAASHITSPQEQFGFNFGDDYQLATYAQLTDYWHKLDGESDRLVVKEIGKTAEGRPHLMAIVTSPANHARLERYREISERLALAEGLTDDQARALAKEGKAVVWIDGGLHATETLGAQQLGEMVYQMVSRSDEETLRFLDDTILLFVHANPDGHDLVANWYMRNPDPKRRSKDGLPRLYQKYIGHDNNRDFFASTQPETENMNRVMYHQWFPQVLYNHHQTGPAGAVLWSSPMRDPYNYNLDPSLILGLQALGTALHQRLAAEGKPGATMGAGGPYDGWWNGGIRNTANYHNILGILTEMIGDPTPVRIPFIAQRQVPTRDLAYPITPQEWHFRQSIDYSVSANRAIIDYAARMRENLLFNIYRMGRNGIEHGSHDYWTPSPHVLTAVAEKMGQTMSAIPALERGGPRAAPLPLDQEAAFWAAAHAPELRDPRAYIIRSDQPDFPTAVKFINALRELNVAVHRATREFQVQGKTYPSGSFVVLAAQAFRPHVMDMFEPQDHPNVFPFPGAPPIPPYDNAGWTLAFQMGVEVDRVFDTLDGPFEKITSWNVAPPPGAVTSASGAMGYVTSRRVNDAATAVNKLLSSGEEVFWLATATTVGNRTYPPGTFYVTARKTTPPLLEQIARTTGVSFEAVRARPAADALKMKAPRVGLWDMYGGSVPSGWTRWILEQYGFPYERTFVPQLDAGNLRAKYDALVFVDGAIPETGGTNSLRQPRPEDIPAEFRDQLGAITAANTLPRIREFAEAGGTVIAIGDSAKHLAEFLKLPVEDHLVENGKPLPRTKYYVPGSVLTARVDTAQPLAHGMPEQVDMFFDNSPVFRLTGEAAAKGVKAIAWFDTPTPLHSGWAWGQQYLDKGVTVVEAPVGAGRVLLFGPEILQRAQPHGTFKLFFNALLSSAAARTTASSGSRGAR